MISLFVEIVFSLLAIVFAAKCYWLVAVTRVYHVFIYSFNT